MPIEPETNEDIYLLEWVSTTIGKMNWLVMREWIEKYQSYLSREIVVLVVGRMNSCTEANGRLFEWQKTLVCYDE